ncbi:hypothetical protein [Desertibacillus haloalkaliphilus]|uniref:hypothetical protein n=1 Tax=Desertibacillus haloalkaliphilus TaxID=1328930 RepID=UPI001C260C38|nr:hypothetical protein [Desertibacillus haloalkaliphilus]MBU8908545.1 hypothetical protein [Desertibacillus haloalkaliphilus]
MNKKQARINIFLAEKTYCDSCDDRSLNNCLHHCVVGRRMQMYGAYLQLEKEKRWSKGELFYMENHLDVLGIEKGAPQVANRLGCSEVDVEFQYTERKKTNHMAV